MRILIVLFVLSAAGCAYQSPSSNFYVLSPRAQPGPPVQADLLLGVGPVNIADYLDRSQIVRRQSDVSLRLDEFNRWAGDYGKNITTVLAYDLARILGSEGVLPYPWSSSINLDYQVLLDISRFDTGPDNRVILDVQWQLFRKHPDKLLLTKRSHIETQASNDSLEAQVQAQSEALAQMGAVIAAALRNLLDDAR